MVATILVERIAFNIPTCGPFTKRPLLATVRPEALLTVGTGEALMGVGLGTASNRVSGPILTRFNAAVGGHGESALLMSF